jgi:hypothetical protein
MAAILVGTAADHHLYIYSFCCGTTTMCTTAERVWYVLSTEVCRDDLRVRGLGKRGREGDRPGGPIIFLLSLRLYEPYETDIFATLLKMILIYKKIDFSKISPN